jgi:hypothetical protein
MISRKASIASNSSDLIKNVNLDTLYSNGANSRNVKLNTLRTSQVADAYVDSFTPATIGSEFKQSTMRSFNSIKINFAGGGKLSPARVP